MGKNILVINHFGIGDVLFSTPLLKAIKRRYPDASVTYVCNKRTEGLLKGNENISNIYVFEKDDYRRKWRESKIKCLKSIYEFINKIKHDKYDAVIDMSLGYIYSFFLWTMTSIPLRIGFNYRNRGRFLTKKLNIEGFSDKHVIEYYLELGKFLGLDADDKEMELMVSPESVVWADRYLKEHGISESDKVCAIIPGCGASWGKDAYYRRWSAWKFAELANYVADRYGYKIIIFGSGSELEICSKVEVQMSRKVIQSCGKTDLAQCAALLNRCDLVVTNDGGPLHMAVSLKKRTVSIFGPVDPRIYGPYPPGDRYIAVTSQDSCRPCYKNFKHKECKEFGCLKNIKVDDVKKAVDRLVAHK